ncbi:ABC transporter permease subunit [candidate division KSB1 bacterium]|nr:ABC transporter permease subunit [candidate division KSB1 bacterium]NIR73471.1 ABC transporter permease subunit [candidate division KSB1 bacterium]NIS25275.1 ABC transporter permease subunit [candidate division KSB1 bacterium]NIT72179.1 ABC transporter permease subunit [candidate division KSB1 bacterium]NIU25997.1 ABC transporter permease subunit [candidate division KSB1 bacterium]
MKRILRIAQQEISVQARNRWLHIFTLVFSLLLIGIAYFGLRAMGYTGTQDFTRTSASLLNLVIYIVPLLALVLGTLGFSGDEGTQELLYSLPLPRRTVFWGKFCGLYAALALPMLSAFLLTGLFISIQAGSQGIGQYLGFMGVSLILALVFLNLSGLVSVLFPKKLGAFAVSLFLWLFLVVLYDLGVIGTTLFLPEYVGERFVFGAVFFNPIDLLRIAGLMLLGGKEFFGQAGATFVHYWGEEVIAVGVMGLSVLLWLFIPQLAILKRLNRLDF